MEKKYIRRTVLSKSNGYSPVTWEQIKDFQFEDGDIIEAGHQEETYHSDGGYSDHFYFHVERNVLETDEQFEKRKKRDEYRKEEMKKQRYESYLKLKKEFENAV